MFQPLIVIYKMGNFVYYHWRFIFNYRPLSYPFRFLCEKSNVQEKADNDDLDDEDFVPEDGLVDENGEDGAINNGESGTFHCDVCNKSFTTSLKFYYHKRNHRYHLLNFFVVVSLMFNYYRIHSFILYQQLRP